MKVTLLNPAVSPRKYTDREEYLGIAYLASALRERGHAVTLLDASLLRWGNRRVIGEILKSRCDFLGVSVHQAAAPVGFAAARALRRHGFEGHVCFGGHFPSFCYRQVLEHVPEIDTVVVGEGERTVTDLLEALELGTEPRDVPGVAWRQGTETRFNGPRPLIEDLDSLPWPARDSLALVPRKLRKAALLTSRGCYAHCSYCSVTHFYRLSPGRVWRGRSPGDVADEIHMIVRDHQVDEFAFTDDNFLGAGSRGVERAFAIADEIDKRGLKIRFSFSTRADQVEKDLFARLRSAGLSGVFIGVESGLQKDLDYYRKGVTVEQNRRALKMLSELGIDHVIGFIPFHRTSTLSDFIENVLFFGEFKVAAATSEQLRVLVGTDIERDMARDGLLSGPFYDPRYRFTDRRVAAVAQLNLCNKWVRLHASALKDWILDRAFRRYS